MDEALVNFFRIIRWARSAFFQLWAARFATGGIPDDAYILHHPLLADPLFKNFESMMQRTLCGVAQSAVSAVEQMIPQLASVVEAVEGRVRWRQWRTYTGTSGTWRGGWTRALRVSTHKRTSTRRRS